MFYIACVLLSLHYWSFFQPCHGHGYLADPPARSSAWLFDSDFTACCQHYNHMEMFCGGAYYQWMINGGKCSICGEAYDAKPRLLGLGDAMYLGKIVRNYTQGATIPVTVVLTANHRGIFEFRVCSIDSNPHEDATQTCLDLNLLTVINNSTQYDIESSFMTVHVNVTLPANLTCKHCVFQWKYITGNSWGVSNGTACVGCGQQNEEFYGCSDIAILAHEDFPTHAVTTKATTPMIDTTTTTVSRKCSLAVSFSRSFDLTALMTQYCHTICSTDCASDRVNSPVEISNDCIASCDKLCTCK